MTVKFSGHLEAGITGNLDDPSDEINFGHLFTDRANTPLLNQLLLTMVKTRCTALMTTLPFALVGGLWQIYLLGFNMSIASAVGFIALAGVAAEFGVVMLIYVDQAVQRYQDEGRLNSDTDLTQAIMEGAALRVRPLAMTVAVVIAGLLPLFWGQGMGSEVMQRIAAPMVGDMVTAPLLSMFVLPAAYFLIRRRRLKSHRNA